MIEESQEVSDFLIQENIFNKPEDFEFDLRKIKNPFIRETMIMIRGQKIMMDFTINTINSIIENDNKNKIEYENNFAKVMTYNEYLEGLCEDLKDSDTTENFIKIAKQTRKSLLL